MIEKLKDKLRMAEFGTAGLILFLLIVWIAPEKAAIVVYKVLLVTLFAHLGYWIDRRLAPYGRPEASMQSPEYRIDMLRRAIVVAASMLTGGLAL